MVTGSLVEPIVFQSTLSVRRATTRCCSSPARVRPISIHALRQESDHYTHPIGCKQIEFQSTLSVRRATPLIPFRARLNSNFNPRSP